MAHIASCMADSDDSISKGPPRLTPMGMISPPAVLADRPYIWRMQQPEQHGRYQLFPKERQLPALNKSKAMDAEKANALNTSPTSDKNDKPSPISGLRVRITQHNMARRRKVSVPDVGPMTTVQEVPMDSPTIPGRPALHERSISAPGNSWMQQDLDDDDDFAAAVEEAFMLSHTTGPRPSVPFAPRYHALPPLVIPESASRVIRKPVKRAFNHMRSESTPIDACQSSARLGSSPRAGKASTPSGINTPRSAGTNAFSAGTAPTSTPRSAPSNDPSPKPWEQRSITPMNLERATTPLPNDGPRTVSASGHRRGESESSGIMDRGRPRKRSNSNSTPSKNDSKCPRSSERKAFEELPEGWKPKEAVHKLSVAEAATLQRQAYGQAERFEILRADDVDAMSKELRSLDERTEYLRRTYTSLRTGRRNLHSRICQYLRSPRVARFSYEAMLKQEEALAELDASIDDWVMKLEKAENRRTRVRQKLLEHVAAAAILPVAGGAHVASESLQQAIGLQISGVCDISTPPRSPTKPSFPSCQRETNSPSPSPQRVVAQVPSTILEQPVVEEALKKTAIDEAASKEETKRADVESIRIYAGDDVYTLLADVEKEFSKMSSSNKEQIPKEASDEKRTQLHRQQSHELLSGMGASPVTAPSAPRELKNINSPMPDSPPAPTPPMKDDPVESSVLLSKATFRPA